MTAVLAAIDALAEYVGPALETDREDAIPVPLRLIRALVKARKGAA